MSGAFVRELDPGIFRAGRFIVFTGLRETLSLLRWDFFGVSAGSSGAHVSTVGDTTAISGDGDFVAYGAPGSDAPGDTNGIWDVIVVGVP